MGMTGENFKGGVENLMAGAMCDLYSELQHTQRQKL